MMKAVRLTEVGSPLQDCKVNIPEPGLNEILVGVKATGICHSDAHYRAGTSPVSNPPITLGHEVAGVVAKKGEHVSDHQLGDRICIHYLVTCGRCRFCRKGAEQFCRTGKMIGKHIDGGYAEYIKVPAENCFTLPENISFQQGAVLMCSSATSFHALKKARIKPGETVAVFGTGGLGMSAVQLAFQFGALDVFAVDINSRKLETASRFGAIPVNAAEIDPVERIFELTRNTGVDVALELIGLPSTMKQAIESTAPFGRAALVGITDRNFELSPYRDSGLINKESEIIGVSDHLSDELPLLLEWASREFLDLSDTITKTVSLNAEDINSVLDRLDNFSSTTRTVIKIDST